MPMLFYPLAGALANAEERQAILAGSVLHLFKSDLNPNPSTPLSEFTANEADYTGYAAIPFATWHDPILAPGSGYMIESPYAQFDTGATTPVVANLIGGAYLVDSGGDLRMCVIFDTPVPMEVAHQGIPIQLIDLFPTGF